VLSQKDRSTAAKATLTFFIVYPWVPPLSLDIPQKPNNYNIIFLGFMAMVFLIDCPLTPDACIDPCP
jgi:hypothetical protein